jgi:ribosomal protein L14E/L6E/L27E
MDTQAIIAALDQEIARLQEVRALLGSAAKVNGPASIKRSPGRPKKLASVVVTKKRILSPEAKAKIAEAQKARWAKARKAAKKAAKSESAA